jgi:4-phospho-D-threonate 3-dehydrogenase / 4-phospho-D-erythronate 3-dehydrogenase
MKPHLAITMGDPAGVGPEIIVRAAEKLKDRVAAGQLGLLIIGSVSQLRAAEALLGAETPIPETTADAGWPDLAILSAGAETQAIDFGKLSAQCGDFAYRAVEAAVRFCEAGRLQGIVTAPLNKEALNLAGHHYAGHTDMIAALSGARDSVMLLAHGNMRVSHLTTHIALEDVPKKLTPARLSRVVELTAEALVDLGLARARIAVAALNPHGGEGGLFGRQDIEVSTPTIAALRDRGYDVHGPVPGDTVFVKLRGGQYDAVGAMYHDQGHIPVKLLGFDVDPTTGKWNSLSGVNITLGTPIVRSSVDHGTAFDIAGQGIASETSLVEAIDYAERLAAARIARPR